MKLHSMRLIDSANLVLRAPEDDKPSGGLTVEDIQAAHAATGPHPELGKQMGGGGSGLDRMIVEKYNPDGTKKDSTPDTSSNSGGGDSNGWTSDTYDCR